MRFGVELRSSINNISNINENLSINEQQMLLSPSSPLTPLSTKIQEQQSIEELFDNVRYAYISKDHQKMILNQIGFVCMKSCSTLKS